uniref:(northern house mosquito) hypothetical protein n=1 Tax=Culex pipiens TaxID=7175 RepID=A0A8D8FUM9_CULPI
MHETFFRRLLIWALVQVLCRGRVELGLRPTPPQTYQNLKSSPGIRRYLERPENLHQKKGDVAIQCLFKSTNKKVTHLHGRHLHIHKHTQFKKREREINVM